MHSGPIPLYYMMMWAYVPLIYLARVHHPRHLLYTDCSASFPPSFTQWAHTFLFYDTVGLYPLIYLHSEHHPRHLLYTDCPASFLLFFHSGPIPPHFMTMWAYTPHLLTQWTLPLPSTVHRLPSLPASFTCTVGPYFLIL